MTRTLTRGPAGPIVGRQTSAAATRSAAEVVSRTGQILNQITGVRPPVTAVSTASATSNAAAPA